MILLMLVIKLELTKIYQLYNDTTSWTEVNGLNVLDEALNTTVDGNINVNSSLRSVYNVTTNPMKLIILSKFNHF